MKISDKLLISGGVGVIGGFATLFILLLAGWISNIVQLVYMAQADNVCAMFWLKIAGCFLAPIGGVLGIVGWF